VIRIVLLTLAVLIIAGVALYFDRDEPVEPLLIQIVPLPVGTRILDIGEISPRTRSLIYNMTVESRTAETVNLKVRLGPDPTEGIAVRLAMVQPVRPAGRESLRLVVAPPLQFGPFQAKIILYADELPDWTYVYEFKGAVVDKPLKGKYLDLIPSGIDLGTVRLGEKKKFKFELFNFGDTTIEVSEIRPRDPASVQIVQAKGGLQVRPGDTRTVEGEARITGEGKRFESRIEVISDAINGNVLSVGLWGTLRSDYDIAPARLPSRSAYPSLGREYTIKIGAASGIAPFVVENVAGLDPLFELAKPLSKEPAVRQSITLRLRRDAPTGQDFLRGSLRISIEPAHVTLAWPYALRALPPVNAQPAQINFGTVQRATLNKPIERVVRIVALPGRLVNVTGVRAARRYFQVRLAEHKAGMPWEVVVVLPALADKGVYRDQILIETSDPDVPKLLIPVRATVR